jgi:hypothetical protein
MPDDISLKISAKDAGAKALLQAVAEALKQLTESSKQNAAAAARDRSEAEKIAATYAKSQASIQRYVASIRAQMTAMKALVTAQHEASMAAREHTRAQQQATQAAIEGARSQRQAIAEQTRALQQQTQAQVQAASASARAQQQRTASIIKGTADQVRAMHAQTQAMVEAGRQQANQQQAQIRANIASASQAARTQQQATQAALQGNAQQARAMAQQTQAALAGTRATVAALNQQTQATNRATAAASRLAAAQIAASNRAAAAQHAAAAVQVAQINAASRAQVAQINAASRAGAAMRQHNTALRENAVRTHTSATATHLLVRRLIQLGTAITGARQFMAFIRAGFQFNETVNQATLGIATLITAQAKLYDSQNRLLEGSKALDAAMAVSEEQVTQLRVAGLATAATTEQLVTAFQQAVGPGLRSGLNLDEIRKFTIGVTQAASAIGLPMHQLNEEVRSLLAGTVTYNTRIAKTLGISNELISSWKQQGVFAERLIQRFSQFSLAGERSMQNMTVLLSNLKEGFDVFAGAATKPLFDALRREGNAALVGFFDIPNAKIADKFQGIVKIAQDIFGSIGSLMTKAIRNAFGAAAQLSRYFEENRASIDGVIAGAKELATQMGRVLGVTVEIIAKTLGVAAETGTWEKLLRSIAKLMQLTADTLGWTIKQFQSHEFQEGLDKITTFLKWTPVGIGFRVISGGLSMLGEALGTVDVAAEKAQRSLELADEKARDNATEVAKLTVEYELLKKKIDSGKLSGAGLAEAQEKLKTIVAQIIQIAPQYTEQLSKWGAGAKETAQAVKQLQIAQENLLVTQFESARANADTIKSQLDLERDLANANEAASDRARAAGDNTLADKFQDQAKQARESIERLTPTLDDAENRVTAILGAMNNLNKETAKLKPTKIVPDPEDKEPKKSNDFRQMIEAAIEQVRNAFKRAKDALDEELDHQEISFADYVTTLLRAERDAVNAEIKLRRELLAHTEDVGERAKIQQDINDLVNRRIGLAQDAKRKLTDLEKSLNDELAQLSLARLRQDEQTGEARRIELEQQFQKLRRVMEINKVPTLGLDDFINVEVARAKLEDLNRVISRASSQAQNRIGEINALAARGMITTAEQARAVGAAYDAQIAAIERALPAMRAFAEASKNDEAIESVRQLEVELGNLVEAQRLAVSDLARYVEIGLNGFQSGVAEAFGNIGTHIEETVRYFDENTGKMVEKTKERLYSLIDFAKDVSLSILRALQQQLAQEFAQNLTRMARGALAKIGINIGGDMSSAVLQQTAAKEQVAAATTNVQAASTFAASMATLQGMLPALSATLGGAAAGDAIGNATVREIGAVAGDGAVEAAELAAATGLQAAGAALLTASSALGASMVPSATALSGAAAALSAAAAALARAALANGASGAEGLVNQINSFSRGIGQPIQMGGAAAFGAGLNGGQGLSGPRRSMAFTTTDQAVVMPSFTVPNVSSPTMSRYADGGAVDASVAALARGSGASATPQAVRVMLDVQSNDSHILKVQQSDPGAAVTMRNLRRNRRSAKGIIG